MIFIKSTIKLLGLILENILKLILNIISDLYSFRNKLVVFTCILVAIVVINNDDFRVSLASLGLLEIFLCYYFNNRKIKDESIIRKNKSLIHYKDEEN